MDKLLDWWRRGLIAALSLSIVLLGVGRVEFVASGGSMSAWSVSRTTFFFWLLWKLLLLYHRGWAEFELNRLKLLAPLYLFFIAVTLSLLPDFHAAGDYRYFVFGCAHAVMLVDVFSSAPQRRWLLLALGVPPLILVLRGLANDPILLDITQMMPPDATLPRRFGYPSDHPNIIGYLFSMTIPLSLAIAMGETGKLRVLALLSCFAQLVALALTYSRGSWLGWGAAMAFLVVTMKRRREVAVVLVATALIATIVTPLRSRLSSLLSPRSDLSITDRMQVIESTLKLAWANPILGVGYGRGRLREGLGESRLEMRRIAHTHNVYVELLATTGLLGLGAFLWLICGAFYQALRHSINREAWNQPAQLGIAAAWIAFAVTGLGDVPFYHHETRIFFFSLFALARLYDSHGDRERCG